MNIRFYQDEDYHALVQLYKTSHEFSVDEETDARERVQNKIKRDPQSIILALDGEKIVGSVSLIEDGRIALLFRLVAHGQSTNQSTVIAALVEAAEDICRERGYKEVHTIAPIENKAGAEARVAAGFTQGKDYSWFWKKI